MIKEFLLKQIGTEAIWNFLLRETDFSDVESPGEHFVTMAFNRVPEFKTWLKAREVQLLKGLMLGDRTNEFVKGQIFEVKLLQRFDIPSKTPLSKVEGEVGPKVPDKMEFLNKWNPHEENKKERSKVKK